MNILNISEIKKVINELDEQNKKLVKIGGYKNRQIYKYNYEIIVKLEELSKILEG